SQILRTGSTSSTLGTSLGRSATARIRIWFMANSPFSAVRHRGSLGSLSLGRKTLLFEFLHPPDENRGDGRECKGELQLLCKDRADRVFNQGFSLRPLRSLRFF